MATDEAAALPSGSPFRRLIILEAKPRKSSPVATAKDFLVGVGGGGGGAEEEEEDDEVSLVSELGVE